MTQSTQGHTLIINIQLDDSSEGIYYKIDQLMLASGQIPRNGDPAAQIHFDCLDCQTRYFISPQIVRVMEMDTVSKLKVSKVEPVDVKNASEPDWLESGSSDEVLTDDDEVLEVEKKVPVAIGNNKEKQDSKVLVKNEGQNNRHRQKKEISEEEKKYTCDICKSYFKHRNYLIQHMEVHRGTRYSCSECRKSFSRKGYLAMHKKQFHMQSHLACLASSPPKTKIKKEQESKAVVNDDRIQKQRLNVHLGIRYSCSECSKSYIEKYDLSKHKQRFHKSEFRICELCKWNKTCTKAEYHSHLRRRHPEFHIKGRQPNVQNFNGVEFPCIYCEPQAIFKNFKELKEHLRVTHYRKFPCSCCPKAYNFPRNLKNHTDSIHEKKKVKCPR